MVFIGFFSTPLPYIILMCFYMWAGLMYMTQTTHMEAADGQSMFINESMSAETEAFHLTDSGSIDQAQRAETPLLFFELLHDSPYHPPPPSVHPGQTFCCFSRPPPYRVM